jgi:hypothetical protein
VAECCVFHIFREIGCLNSFESFWGRC